MNGPYVFVVTADQKAEMRTVTVGRVVGSETVIEKGIEPGETVVLEGHLMVTPGAKLELTGDKADPQKPASAKPSEKPSDDKTQREPKKPAQAQTEGKSS
jgi:hypothetical protein